MRILAVDTSTPAGGLAALEDTRVLGVVATWSGETYSSRMFRHLDFLLRETGLEMQQFDLYAVAAGPGSFTGLRVGLAAVKGWAEVHGKPIAAVSGLEAVAWQARNPAPLLAAVLDARRGQVFGGFYERVEHRLALRGDEVVMTPGGFLEQLSALAGGRETALVTPTPEVITPALAGSAFHHAPVEQVSTVLAPIIGLLGYARALRGQVVDAVRLDANYIRRSDAELLWKGPA